MESSALLCIKIQQQQISCSHSFILLLMSKLAGEKRDVHMERRESELWIEKHYKIHFKASIIWLENRTPFVTFNWLESKNGYWEPSLMIKAD
nr:protein root UVB sensitive 3 isoform X2 [Ipomoea batatas]